MTFSTSTVKSRYTTGSTILRPGKWGADPGSRPQGPVFWNAFLTIFQFCAWDWLGLKVLSGRGTLSLGQSPPVPTSPLVSTLGLPMCTWNWSESQGALRFILPGFLVPCGWVLHPGGWPGAWIASLACALFLLQDCTRWAARMVLVYWFWMSHSNHTQDKFRALGHWQFTAEFWLELHLWAPALVLTGNIPTMVLPLVYLRHSLLCAGTQGRDPLLSMGSPPVLQSDHPYFLLGLSCPLLHNANRFLWLMSSLVSISVVTSCSPWSILSCIDEGWTFVVWMRLFFSSIMSSPLGSTWQAGVWLTLKEIAF